MIKITIFLRLFRDMVFSSPFLLLSSHIIYVIYCDWQIHSRTQHKKRAKRKHKSNNCMICCVKMHKAKTQKEGITMRQGHACNESRSAFHFGLFCSIFLSYAFIFLLFWFVCCCCCCCSRSFLYVHLLVIIFFDDSQMQATFDAFTPLRKLSYLPFVTFTYFLCRFSSKLIHF